MTIAFIWALNNLALGFLMGKYYERWKWNKLISKGVIPSPQKTEVPHHRYEEDIFF